MERMIISLCTIFIGIITGIAIRYVHSKKNPNSTMPACLEKLRSIGIYILNPIVMILAFWAVDLGDLQLLLLPLLCFLSYTISGVAGILCSRLLKHDGKKKGALYVVSAFSNMGSFGCLTSYALLGEAGLTLASLYRIGEELYYYIVGFPVSRYLGQSNDKSKRKRIAMDKHVFLFIGVFIVGLLFNRTGLQRPNFFDHVVAVLVPVSAFCIVLAPGYLMRFGKIRDYKKECACLIGIKFMITPVIMMCIFFALDLHLVQGGILIKVLLIMSCMPSALTALIPPRIFGLDYDLANACWIASTATYILMLPVLALVALGL